MKHFQYDLNFRNELIVDNFAGGGGASIGIELGTNRFVNKAINHDKKALNVHELNHPYADHIQEDVFKVDPVEVCNGRKVGLGWFSPDCRHFSRAKGSVPVKKNIRGLAWVARRWVKTLTPTDQHPRIIILENVKEFLDWGPLIPIKDKHGNVKRDKNGEIEMMPDPKRKGLTFNTFNGWFKRNGYKTDWKILKACDYGAPTIRERLFWIARRDGLPIVWPKPTHGPKGAISRKKGLKPYRTAAECIDFSIPCPSIFMDADEAKAYLKETGSRIIRPLADATLRRIAKGIVKYVLHEKQPFIVPIANYSQGTVFLAKHYTGVTGSGLKEPIGTVTSIDHHSLVEAKLSRAAVESGAERVVAFLLKYYGQSIGQDLKEPLHTLPTRDRFGLVTVNIKGEPWVIVDIGIRMLQPEELKLAQGFPADYNLGNHTKTTKVRLIGNSVCPPVAAALVQANCADIQYMKATA